MNDLGTMIKTMRKSRGMSQTDLAEALGVSRSTVSMWEINKNEPSLDDLDALADCFNVDMSTLLGADDELAELREMMRRSPMARTLFRLTRNASDQQIRQAVAVLKGLMETGED